jgi:hypothetical protein
VTREEATTIVPLIQKQTDTVALIESHLIPNSVFSNRKHLRSPFTADPPGAILIRARETDLPIQAPMVQVGSLDPPADIKAPGDFGIAVEQVEGSQGVQVEPTPTGIRGSVQASIRVGLRGMDDCLAQETPRGPIPLRIHRPTHRISGPRVLESEPMGCQMQAAGGTAPIK